MGSVCPRIGDARSSLAATGRLAAGSLSPHGKRSGRVQACDDQTYKDKLGGASCQFSYSLVWFSFAQILAVHPSGHKHEANDEL